MYQFSSCPKNYGLPNLQEISFMGSGSHGIFGQFWQHTHILLESIARKLNKHLTTNNQVVFITPTCAFFFSLRFEGFNLLQWLKQMVASRYSNHLYIQIHVLRNFKVTSQDENNSLYLLGNSSITYKHYKKIKSRASESCCVSTLWASWIPRHLNIPVEMDL